MDLQTALGSPLSLAWSSAGRPLRGMPVNGDAVWTVVSGSRAQVALMDGLGHGFDAAAASRAALDYLRDAEDAALEDKMEGLHQALRRTRGAALALADVDLGRGRLRWCGVGNILGLLLLGGRRERLVNGNGIVGLSLPSTLRVRTLPLEPGGSLLLATDGLDEAVASGLDGDLPPALLAPTLLARHARASDDALLWVGRLDGLHG